MLNGKFFTGLPPKMMDRNCSGQQNRLESHIFWPDDTQVESAVENRVRRRSSFNAAILERPRLQHQSSLQTLGENEVDTKAKFHNEFGKSSIQFYDNIHSDQQQVRRGRRNSWNVHQPSQEITVKPTSFKPALPESSGDEAFVEAKKKECLTSKIQFYDYSTEPEPRGGPQRRLLAKMDMNDKRQVERNSKNSPKLQEKRNVRSLSREAEEAPFDGADEGGELAPPSTSPRPIAMRRNNFEPEPRRRILRHPVYQDEGEYQPQDRYGPRNGDMGYVENNMRRLAVRDSPRKHVTYEDEVEEDEARRYAGPGRRYYGDDDDYHSYGHNIRKSATYRATPTKPLNTRRPTSNRSNNEYAPTNVEQQQQQQQQQQKQYMATGGGDSIRVTSEAMAAVSEPPTLSAAAQHRPLNTNNKNSNNSINNSHTYRANNNNTRLNNENQTSPPSRSAAMQKKPSPNDDSAAECSPDDKQKHLRSSLFFHNGEIVAAAKPSTTTSTAPARRNARSSATQRVSVGLPD